MAQNSEKATSTRRGMWIGGTVMALVVTAIAFFAGPRIFSAVQGDDAPAAAVNTSGAQAASADISGSWKVIPGERQNITAAGYTVREILRGESVTVVGSTTEVSGTATVRGTSLLAADFVVDVASIKTDSGRRDSQFVGPSILDAATHPKSIVSLAEPVDLAAVPGDGTAAKIMMPLTLDIKGRRVMREVEVTVLRDEQWLVASGALSVKWAEFGVTPPSLGFVTVNPEGTVDFLVALAK